MIINAATRVQNTGGIYTAEVFWRPDRHPRRRRRRRSRLNFDG